MAYSEEQSKDLNEKAQQVCADLFGLVEGMLFQRWQPLAQQSAQEYLSHGVCRRLHVMRHAIESVFRIFPPDRSAVLERDELLDVQSYLHAFVINVYGVLDNLAWVFVLERNLLATVGGRMGVGLFARATQSRLPAAVRDYLQSPAVTDWYSTYAKNYRDALAHRIPLYVPPFALRDDERYKDLDRQMSENLLAGNVDRYEELKGEQAALRIICPAFRHSTTDPVGSRPLQLHPQMLVDAMTIAEIAHLFGREFDGAP